MTITKEDLIRTKFEAWILSHQRSPHENWWEYQTWKACAESYEKKLAEKDAEIATHIKNVHHFQNAYVEAQLGISEANARNAMLVNALIEIKNNRRGMYYEMIAALVDKAISANSEAVAAWEAEKLGPDAQLCKFYGVSTYPDLVSAMERHITKLQEKLPVLDDFKPTRVREG